MSEYKGFRIFNLEFQAMNSSTDGYSAETVDGVLTGRLKNTINNTIYWSEDDKGLAACLEDYLSPMINNETTNGVIGNGVGWSLDTDLYTRLNALNKRDPLYKKFKESNPLLYTPDTPTGSKTVKLVPTTYTRVMCFKHTTGYKAMIGLSLYAMDSYESFSEYTTDKTYYCCDPGFLRSHTVYPGGYYSSYYHYPIKGGLFVSMIPPSNDPDVKQDDWNLEYSILDEKFYSPTMQNILHMFSSYRCSGSDSYYTSYYPATSWLHTGTSTQANVSTTGVVPGTNMKLSLMLDTKGNIGLSYKYTASSNTTKLNPIIFMGPLYKSRLSKTDTLCTNKLGLFVSNISLPVNDSTYNDVGYSYRNSAWYSSSYSSSSYYNYICNYTSFTGVLGFTPSGSPGNIYSAYTAYPACNSSVYTNYRYAKAAYTTVGLLDEDVIKFTAYDGLIIGQTYNDSQWIFLGWENTLRAQDGTTSSAYLYPSLKWDADFNETKTFA